MRRRKVCGKEREGVWEGSEQGRGQWVGRAEKKGAYLSNLRTRRGPVIMEK